MTVEHLTCDMIDKRRDADIFSREKPKENLERAVPVYHHVYEYVSPARRPSGCSSRNSTPAWKWSSTTFLLSTHIPMASYLGEGSWIEFNNHARSARLARRRAARSWALQPAATKRIRC